LKLLSPLKGWVAPLDEVSDAVFAGRMLGEGVAIDPISDVLVAPCEAEVISIARTGHAVTLRTDEGAALLIHIGLDTVALDGAGFEACVEAGARVKAGDPLIRFDLDRLARCARSLITPVLVTNPDVFRLVTHRLDCEIDAGDVLMEVIAIGGAVQTDVTMGERLDRDVVLGFPHGLHARPAARVAALAKPFAADIAVLAGDVRADAKSPIALMTLGAGSGAVLTLSARGGDAAAALEVLGAFLASAGGEAPEPKSKLMAAPPPRPEARDGALSGVCAAPGRAVGPTFLYRRDEVSISSESRWPAYEAAALDAALAQVKSEIASPAASGQGAEIMVAHLALLEDEALLSAARQDIAEGKSAGVAWREVLDARATALRALPDPRLRERAGDLDDLKRRVLIALGGEARTPEVPAGVILLADDLLASELLALSGRIKGLCTAAGGPTSHVAIIAASQGLPALAAAGEGVLATADGTLAVLDASGGRLLLDPPADVLALERLEEQRSLAARAAATAAAAEPARLKSGERIEVFANLGGVADTQAALGNGAEGCGLLRSEFLFMDRPDPPSEDEQRAAYQAIADALDGRPLIVRTLDIGGDKPVAYLPLPKEENPALGLRGVRTSLWRPDLLRTQLRAILRVRPFGLCKIMVPMVASPNELIAVREMLEAEKAALGVTDRIELGVMIETPAAAVTARAIAKVADFLSIGTNDLTQYALAMDRGNPLVAAGIDALHPAVLRLIALTCEGAQAEGKPVGVCGALASEPLAAAALVGLGVTELSATPTMIPELKARLRGLTLKDCRHAASTALAAGSAGEARAHLAVFAEGSAAEPPEAVAEAAR
jgi:phosphocarrier protein FPr/phosphocarrier protein